ncbi:hypothetical protein LCGC14_2917380, partial [marine sediment metagenome]
CLTSETADFLKDVVETYEHMATTSYTEQEIKQRYERIMELDAQIRAKAEQVAEGVV